MKIGQPIPRTVAMKARRKMEPVIPLERDEPKELVKGDYETLKLYTKPTDTDSATYKISVSYFAMGKPEEFLKFIENICKVIVG